ncbi:MAG: Fic family protein [Solirubrobacteraceae bacterium]
MPSSLADLDLRLSQQTLTAVADAEVQIAGAQAHADRVGVSTIAVQLLRSEAIASSQIEGITTPGNRALARALIKSDAEQGRPSGPAAATIANVLAVRDAYERAGRAKGPMTTHDIVATHAAIARSDRWLSAHAGVVRETQNWIGRDPITPVGAEFIPPPAHMVPGLLQDLCAYCSRSDVSPMLQAAAAHAQFETIHPFADGNGRVGRTLIGEILCRGGLARDVIPPTSLVLCGRREGYVAELTAWRFDADGPDRWITLLAEATERAARGSIELANRVAALQATWRSLAAHRRADSGARALIDLLPAHPMITAEIAAGLLGRTYETGRVALAQLEADGVLAEVTLGRRNRAYETVGLFALVDELERDLSDGHVNAAATW